MKVLRLSSIGEEEVGSRGFSAGAEEMAGGGGGGGGGHDERKVPLDLKKGRVKKEDRCSSSKSWDEGYEERSVVSRRKYELRKFADQGLGEVESPPRAWNGPTAPTGSQTSP